MSKSKRDNKSNDRAARRKDVETFAERPFIGMNTGEVHEEPEAPVTKADDVHDAKPGEVYEAIAEGIADATDYLEGDTSKARATAVAVTGEPVRLQGPFTVAGGNVLDAGDNVIAMCGFSHNRVASGPAVAGAVMTALNRFYRHPVEVERDKP